MAVDHLDTLLIAREKLVAQRRDLAASLASDYQRGHTDDRRTQFIEIQLAIEALDRAVADERATREFQETVGDRGAGPENPVA